MCYYLMLEHVCYKHIYSCLFHISTLWKSDTICVSTVEYPIVTYRPLGCIHIHVHVHIVYMYVLVHVLVQSWNRVRGCAGLNLVLHVDHLRWTLKSGTGICHSSVSAHYVCGYTIIICQLLCTRTCTQDMF